MYTVNHNYFSDWTYNSSYIQGFTMSDGCIDDKNGHRMLCYNLAEQDIDVLTFIKSEICPDKPIYHKNGTVYLSIWSNQILKDLSSLNIVPRKTGNEKLPQIPSEHKNSYLLGLFDGDGNICSYFRHRKSGKRIGSNRHDYEYRIFSASIDFLKEVQSELCFGYGNITFSKTCYALRISKAYQIQNIYDFMYSSKCDFKLIRKHNVFSTIPKPPKFEAFQETKYIDDWLVDDRCLIKNKRLILERVERSNMNFELAITKKSNRKS